MKRVLLMTVAVLIVGSLAAGVWVLNRNNQELELKYASTKAAEDSIRTHFNAALVSIAEIQDSLTAIIPSESAVLDLSQNVERNGALTSTRKDQVLRSIADLNESIRRSKEMIHQFEERLEERELRVAALEKIVDNLKKSVADREQMIAQLTQRVEVLSTEVVTLKADVETGRQQIEVQQQVIESKRQEISTVYYVVSPKRTLKEMGVIRETGGVIGVGKTTRLSGQFPENLFNRLDTDLQTTIPVQGRKPVVLSGQSSSSYQLVPITVDSSELRITDPEEFRKVRYLVIQVS